jgi:hypothetical protein
MLWEAAGSVLQAGARALSSKCLARFNKTGSVAATPNRRAVDATKAANPFTQYTGRKMKKLLSITAAVAAIIAYDHVNNGNTFPSEVYCLMGAGTLWNRETRVPVRDYYDRLTGYTTTPATYMCIHRSLWKGWLS